MRKTISITFKGQRRCVYLLKNINVSDRKAIMMLKKNLMPFVSFGGGALQALCLHTTDAVYHNEGSVCHSQRSRHFRGEIHVSRGINQIDEVLAGFLPLLLSMRLG